MLGSRPPTFAAGGGVSGSGARRCRPVVAGILGLVGESRLGDVLAAGVWAIWGGRRGERCLDRVTRRCPGGGLGLGR